MVLSATANLGTMVTRVKQRQMNVPQTRVSMEYAMYVTILNITVFTYPSQLLSCMKTIEYI